jgi:hypothetical protein
VDILIKWDVFCIYWLLLNVNAGKISDGKNGDVAVDQYHFYKVQMEALHFKLVIIHCFIYF